MFFAKSDWLINPEVTGLNNINMAALLPTILSDDEETNNIVGKSITKKKSKKVAPPIERSDDDGSDDDGASSADEMDGDFEFGGLLVSAACFCNNWKCFRCAHY